MIITWLLDDTSGATTEVAAAIVGPQGVQGPQGAQGDVGPGVAAGGAAGQALVKASGDDYDTGWETIATAAQGALADSAVQPDDAEFIAKVDKSDQQKRLSNPSQNIFPPIPRDPNISTITVTGGDLNLGYSNGQRGIATAANPTGTTNRRIAVDVSQLPAGQVFSTALTVFEKTAGPVYASGVGIHIRMRAYNAAGAVITSAWAGAIPVSDFPSDTTIFRRYLGQAAITSPTRIVVGEQFVLPTGCVTLGFEVFVTNTTETSVIGDFTLRRGAVSDYLRDDGFAQRSEWFGEPVPDEMDWDHANYPIVPAVTYGPSGRPYGDAGLLPEDVFPDHSGWQDIYVQRTGGNDTTGDGSSGLPYQSIARAIYAMNDSAAPANIIVTGGGEYDARTNFWGHAHFSATYRDQQPEQDVRFVATGGVVTSTTRKPLTWTANSTYPHVYEADVGTDTVGRVVFPYQRNNATGRYAEAALVASLAVCAVVPNSWGQVGSTVYVFSPKGYAPTDATCRAYLQVPNFKLLSTASVNVFFDADDGASGWNFEGGSNDAGDEKGGCLAVEITANQASRKVLVGKNCRFRYSSSEDQLENAFCVYNWHGLVAFWNSDASFGARDGWNVHALGTYTNKTAFLLVNPSALEPGIGDAQSANCWTLHEDVKGVVIGGDFIGGTGLPIYIVGSSRGYILGMRMRGGLGDYNSGINIAPIITGTAGTSRLYLNRCAIDPDTSGQLVARALDTSQLLVRHTPLPGSVSAGAGARVTAY